MIKNDNIKSGSNILQSNLNKTTRRNFLKGAATILATTATSFSIPLRVSSEENIKKARFYQKLEGNRVQCLLCPRMCRIKEGKRGICGVRENRNGILYTLVYGKPCALHLDPIEKKPFFHVLPGTSSLSFSTVGCNLSCKFCQNWQISQAKPEDTDTYKMQPESIVESAVKYDARSIAYTYGEPTVFIEYLMDTATLARERGIKNVVVSAGFINKKPLIEMCKLVDAIKIDLKSFKDSYYREICGGRLKPVLNTLETIKSFGTWLEIVYLMVPTLNDNMKNIREMAKWILSTIGPNTPLHFSRFFPQYRLKNLPPTPLSSLELARDICLEEGLKFVYIGNVGEHEAENTYCPSCSAEIISRKGYRIRDIHINNGKCEFCKEEIPGLWQEESD